jgi:hypothetical protein
MSELVEIRNHGLDDDLLVISNVRSWERTDLVETSAHDLAVALLSNREQPKAVFIDEASTHMDARTYRYEVATQWTPLAKRFAKLNVDLCGVVGHTGKDLHPEVKRMATLPFFKTEKDVVEFFTTWKADAESPDDSLVVVENLEPTSHRYDPDDAAPWSWDLEQELFTLDLDWPELLKELQKRGPTDD